MTKTWYNEERNRWEMDPVAVPFAISKNLIERAQIRHDCGVMYLTLKAEDRVYFVDLKVSRAFLEFVFFFAFLFM